MNRMLFLLVFVICGTQIWAQQLQWLDSNANTSLRGLSVVSNKVCWASGSKGTVARTTNGGKTIEWMQVAGYEQRDFRDIEAFDAKTAIIMAIDTPAVLLKTTDGGKTWKKVFEDKRAGMFLDAMLFWNNRSGIVVGDPIDGKIFIIRSFDGGNSWRGLPEKNYPTAQAGEAFFAASGSNIGRLTKDEAVFVTGGTASRLFIRNEKIVLPLIQGSASTGANAIAVRKGIMMVVGGDYRNDTLRTKNSVRIRNRGRILEQPVTPPGGYRSSVVFRNKLQLIACGTSGVDVSEDGGMNWRSISRESFHVVQKAKKGSGIYLAGTKGRIAILQW